MHGQSLFESVEELQLSDEAPQVGATWFVVAKFRVLGKLHACVSDRACVCCSEHVMARLESAWAFWFRILREEAGLRDFDQDTNTSSHCVQARILATHVPTSIPANTFACLWIRQT